MVGTIWSPWRRNAADERAADDAFLHPRLTFRQFAVGGQAGEFGAGARAAGRSIVSFAGAQHEIPRMRARRFRRPEQLDMVHLGKALRIHRLANSPAEIRQRIHVGEAQVAVVFLHKIEPVPTPGDVAGYRRRIRAPRQ